MIFDAVPFARAQSATSSNIVTRATSALVDWVEEMLGVSVVYDAREIPFGKLDLAEPLAIARLLKERGVLRSLAPGLTFPDEPPMKNWRAYDTAGSEAGGTSFDSEASALYAALAESLERYLWHTQTDYFDSPTLATPAEISRRGSYIAPARFAAFSNDQRAERQEMQLHDESRYQWIRARSLVQQQSVYIPAQIISGVKDIRKHIDTTEPLIRMPITTGLATWPTIEGARLAGALEVIERDAYMIMWLNQLILPRISLPWLRHRNQSLSKLIEQCERYHLRMHAIQLLTDAPTHAVCVVIEDMSGNAPRFTIGIRAHGSLEAAVEKAAGEALRARMIYRRYFANGGVWDANTPAQHIGHIDRIYYWGTKDNAGKLEFLIQGEEKKVPTLPCESETPAKQLERIISWCRESAFECASVSLGKSSKNPTPWHVEMVTIPELQTLYLFENHQELGGTRWKSVPEKFGIKPRSKPFSEEPHPFV